MTLPAAAAFPGLMAQRAFMRLWMARLFGTAAAQMLRLFGVRTVLVALLWRRRFPALARRDRLEA